MFIDNAYGQETLNKVAEKNNFVGTVNKTKFNLLTNRYASHEEINKKYRDYFDAKEINKDDNVTIISGPESGFSQQELNFLLKNKIMNRYLGKNILRSETAPVVVAAIIRNHFGKIT